MPHGGLSRVGHGAAAVILVLCGVVRATEVDGLRDPERLFRREVYGHLRKIKGKLDTGSVRAWVGVQEIGSRAATAIRAALDEKDVKLRDQTVWYLGHISNRKYESADFWRKWMDEQSPRSMDDLLEECRDTKHPQKLEMATAALALFYTEKAPAKLIDLVISEKWDRGDRLAIFGVYALDPVEQKLKTERDAKVRVRVITHLGKLYDPRTIEVIETALNDHSPEVRSQAVVELENLALYNPAVREKAVRTLVLALGDRNLTVVTAVRRALDLKKARDIVKRLAGRYQSARSDDTYALIMLGRMCEHGAGVPQDRKKALKCFDTARRLGSEEAKKEYNRLRLLVER